MSVREGGREGLGGEEMGSSRERDKGGEEME